MELFILPRVTTHLFIAYSKLVSQKPPPRTIECQSYKSFNTNAFNQDLASVPWHVVENENNIDDAVLTWNKLFSEIADAHAPFKKRRVKGVPVPLVSEITRFCQQRNEVFQIKILVWVNQGKKRRLK